MEPLIDKKVRVWLALMNFGVRMGCHQMSDRSFSYKGYQFPVCARCTGVIIGEVASIVGMLCGIKVGLMCAIALIVPLAVDGGLQHIKILKSNNTRRVVTGVLAGFGLTYIYYYAFFMILKVFGAAVDGL